MTKGITHLEARGFRGASEPVELQLSKPIAFIFGENGSGKSTLVDALEFVATGGKGSLADRASTQIGDLGTIGREAPPLLVEVRSGERRWSARLQGRKGVLTGDAERPRVTILRRSDLAAVAVDNPAARYEQLEPFIDVSGVRRCEEALARAIDHLGRAFDEKSRLIGEKLEELGEAWRAAGSPAAASAEAWASTQKVDQAESTEYEALRSWSAQLRQALQNGQHCAAEVTGSRAAVAERTLERESAASELERWIRDAAGAAAELQDVLDAGQRWLGKTGGSPAECPLCEQEIADAERFTRRITERLRALAALEEARRRERAAIRAVETAGGALARAEAAHERALSTIRQRLEQAPSLVSDAAAAARRALPGVAAVERCLLAATTELAQWERRVSAAARLEAPLERLRLLRREAKDVEAPLATMRQALEIVRSERQSFTNRVLAEVEESWNAIFRRIHPDENDYGDLALELDPARKASILQWSRFGEQAAVAPQSCFSESHLDTYAFALWLALAKRERPRETVLVLDDVFTSVDQPHLRRIAELLHEESACFAQVIVTTHNRHWYELYRSGTLPNNTVDLVQLGTWRLAEGIRPAAGRRSADDLAQKLAALPFDRQAVASAAGVLLESMLRRLAELYRRKVAYADPPRPTLDELLSAWSDGDAGKLQAVLADGSAVALGPTIVRLKGSKLVRNLVGAHWSALAADVPDSEVEELARLALSLAAGLYCNECGALAARPDEGGFRCRCKKHRLTPAKIG